MQSAASSQVNLAEQKLLAAHKAMLSTKGLQLDFKAVDPPPKVPAWLEMLLQALGALAPVLRYLFWGGLILGVAVIAWLVIREFLGRRRVKAQAAAAAADWRPTEDAARTLLEDADRLAAEGRFGDAVHLLLFRSIEDIGGRRPGLVRPGLTSRDIAALEAMPNAARQAFAAIAQAVERSFFGGRPVGAEDFAQCRREYEAFAFAEGWR